MMKIDDFLKQWYDNNSKILVHTSGSTGKPKYLWVEKKLMINSAKMTCNFLKLKAKDNALLCMPLEYIAGKMMVVRSIINDLNLIDVKPSGNPLSDKSLEHINLDLTPITFAAMVPLQVYNTLKEPIEKERLKKIKHLIIGGGFIDDSIARELKTFPNYIWCSYGMTETLSHIALRRINGKEASQWYSPLNGIEVSTNNESCLIINAPLITHQQIVTNDIAVLRKQTVGYCKKPKTIFKIIGRKDNIINTGGIKIQIEEIENKLKEVINEPFAITKKKSPKFGEEIVLIAKSHNIEYIKNTCKQILPKFWIPHYFMIVNDIPLTATGKPARKVIENLVSNT